MSRDRPSHLLLRPGLADRHRDASTPGPRGRCAGQARKALTALGLRSREDGYPTKTRIGVAVTAALVAAISLSGASPARAATAPQPSWNLPAQPTMLVLGDSWTAGNYVGLANTFVQDAANDMGWKTEMYGISGAGYLNPVGTSRMTYPKMAAQLSASLNPSVIVVQGGSNDWHRDLSQLDAAATQTIRTLQHTFPKATILMVGPGMDLNPLPASYVQIDQILSQVASTQHVYWASALTWITPTNIASIVSPTNGHPTVAGDGYLGGRLAQVFRGYTGQETLGSSTADAAPLRGQGAAGFMETFHNGDLYAGPAGAHGVPTRILTRYTAQGGPAGALGWPTTDTYTDPNGTVQRFQGGAIYVDGSGTITLDNTLLNAYLNAGGPTGQLGWPIAAPTVREGRVTQHFAHGNLTTVEITGIGAWPATGSLPSRLAQGQTLSAGHELLSPDGRFLLTQQPDGNLVLYKNTGSGLWDSSRFGTGYRTVMQTDGNLVQYTSTHRPVWATGTYRTAASNATMQSDGNFVVYTPSGVPLWATNTRGR